MHSHNSRLRTANINKQSEPDSGDGGSMSMGGSISMGGSLPMGGGFDTPQEMYHRVLRASPREFELYRETASQLIGAQPSPMWGKIVQGDQKEPLLSDIKNYHQIINMPTPHSAARLLEAEHGLGQGGGFFRSMHHVLGKVQDYYGGFKKGLGFVQKNQDALSMIPVVGQYVKPAVKVLDKGDKYIGPTLKAGSDLSGKLSGAQKNTSDKSNEVATVATVDTVENKKLISKKGLSSYKKSSAPTSSSSYSAKTLKSAEEPIIKPSRVMGGSSK